jgi:hypothetical protein
MSEIRESYLYSDDTGAANAYSLTYPITSTTGAPQTVAGMPLPPFAAGDRVVFKAANANTGASTLEVNVRGPIGIKKNGTADLASGDIVAGQMVSLIFDGTYWQMVAGAVGPQGIAGSGSVQYGTRASLPSTPGVAGSCYMCSDSPYTTYVSDGTNWNGRFMGLPVADPALDATLVTRSTKTLTSSNFDTTQGGVLMTGQLAGSDDVIAKVIPVTPSSTLVVRANIIAGNAGGGWVIWNDNTGHVVFIRWAGNQLFFSKYLVTAGTSFQSNQSVVTGTFISPFPSGNGSATIAPNMGYVGFAFNATAWAFKTYLDPACTIQLRSDPFTELLSTWIGTNYTHVGLAVSATSTTTQYVWAIDLKIVHT